MEVMLEASAGKDIERTRRKYRRKQMDGRLLLFRSRDCGKVIASGGDVEGRGGRNEWGEQRWFTMAGVCRTKGVIRREVRNKQGGRGGGGRFWRLQTLYQLLYSTERGGGGRKKGNKTLGARREEKSKEENWREGTKREERVQNKRERQEERDKVRIE